MSIKMSITVDVPLKAIADVKAGKTLGSSASGYEVYENVVQAITKSATDFPYDIADTAEIAAEPFELTITTLTNKKIYISATGNDTPETIASKIQDKEGVPPSMQALVYKGQPIFQSVWEDEEKMKAKRTLHSLGINKPTEMHLIVTLRGS